MQSHDVVTLVIAPIGFGLLGFLEPCAIGATLVFIKTTEKNSAATKLAQVSSFALSRALFVGLLGAAAALAGTFFLAAQKAMWTAVGALYLLIGVLYVTGRIGMLTRFIAPGIAPLATAGGSMALGAIMGLNIPACAGPLLLALLAASAAGGATGATLATGFISLGLFGLALSLPLVAVVLVPRATRLLDWISALSRRIPVWTGLVFIALGFWSIGFALVVSIR